MTGQAQGGTAWPVRGPVMLGLLTLALLVGGFGGWAALSEISGAVIAPGRVEVERNRQVVQHPDGGVVLEIHVDEGASVAQGDVLLRLDPTLLQSDLNAVENQLFEIVARRGRLEAERDGRDSVRFDAELIDAAATRPEVADLIEGQEQLFEARNVSVQKEIETLQGRRNQITGQIAGIEAQQISLREQIGYIEQELDDLQSLLDRGLAQASRVLALRREAARLHGTVGELTAAAGEAEERISEIEIEILKLDTRRREEAIARLRDLQFREFELRERRASLQERQARMEITAPASGVVYGMTVFAERAVIRAADPLMYIVPQDRPLVIAAEVDASDVDRVFPGQEVGLRFSAFDSRTTPELTGRVMMVSADAFVDDRSRVSFYRTEIRLNEGEIEKLPGSLALVPGMPVDAFIRTDSRSPIAYLVKPLADYFTKAFRES